MFRGVAELVGMVALDGTGNGAETDIAGLTVDRKDVYLVDHDEVLLPVEVETPGVDIPEVRTFEAEMLEF